MRSKTVAWVGILVLVLAGLSILYFWYTQALHPLDYDEYNDLSVRLYGEADPNLRIIAQALEEEWTMEEFQANLSDVNKVLYYNEDVTGDRYSEFVLLDVKDDQPEETLTGEDFEFVINRLIVYQKRPDGILPIFTIDQDALLDEDGDQLLDQVRAEYGYALRTSTYEHEELYDQPVQLFHLVIVDEDGSAASDQITVFWNPTEQKYQVMTPDM